MEIKNEFQFSIKIQYLLNTFVLNFRFLFRVQAKKQCIIAHLSQDGLLDIVECCLGTALSCNAKITIPRSLYVSQ